MKYYRTTTTYEDAHSNNTQHPTREEFWRWTIKARHDFIRRDAGPRFKRSAPGFWGYLFYPKTDLCVRWKIDRRRRIVAIETCTIAEGSELADRSAMAVSATNGVN
jgi:hypothetical protein